MVEKLKGWGIWVRKTSFSSQLSLPPNTQFQIQSYVTNYDDYFYIFQEAIVEGEEGDEVPPPISFSGPQPFRQRKFSF